MLISERIRGIAPASGAYFRLTAHFSDGSTKVYPIEEGSFFRMGESPFGVPSGRYTVSFFDEQTRPMSYPEQMIVVNLQDEVQRTGQSQLSLHLSPGKTPTGSYTPNSSQAAAAQTAKFPMPRTASGVDRGNADAVSGDSEELPKSHIREADLEFQKYLHAMDLEERQQDFIKNSTYVTEVGEIFALNRIMRRELMELQRIIVLNSQQAYKDVEHVKGTVHDLLQLQKEVLANAVSNISRPPPPPPDYVGLGHSALSLIREIGVALINRSQAKESGKQLPSTPSAPQLPAHSAELPEDRKAQRADFIDKLVNKLKNATDIDMAMAMSSPESWKALFDELMTDKDKQVPPPEADKEPKK